MKKKTKLFIITPLITILILIFSSLSIYYYSFYPKTPVISTNTNIIIDNWTLLRNFFPTGFNLSFKEISAESNTIFSQEELTDLAIATINEMPEIKEYITGLRIDMENPYINLYFHINYKNIPLEAKLIFTCKAENGKGIFHYVDGNLGFIHIPKDLIFHNVNNTSFVQFNKENGDIILSFETIKQLDVKSLQIINNDLIIKFRGTIKFWDWLKNSNYN